MSKKSKIDPAFYDNNCFADDFAEAKKNGTLMVAKKGESTIEVIKRQMLAKKKSETVSVRLPKPLIVTIKQQAKSVSVPWTSYIREVLETSVNNISQGAMRPRIGA